MNSFQGHPPPPCNDFTQQVRRCHKRYGKLGEDCVREELDQKKCFAWLFCRYEARRFYDEKSVPTIVSNGGMKWKTFLDGGGNSDAKEAQSQSRVSCATLVETFAKPENELLIPEGIKKDDRVHCRKIAHELATCLSTKRRGATF